MVWTALTRVFWIEKYAPVSDCLLLDFGGSYLPAMLLLICCSLFGLVCFLVFTWHDMIWWFTMGSDKRIDSCIRWTTQSLSSTGVFFSPNPRERGWWTLFQNMTPYIKKGTTTATATILKYGLAFLGEWEEHLFLILFLYILPVAGHVRCECHRIGIMQKAS